MAARLKAPCPTCSRLIAVTAAGVASKHNRFRTPAKNDPARYQVDIACPSSGATIPVDPSPAAQRAHTRLSQVSEKVWHRKAEGIARALGWSTWHDDDPRRNSAGWPDLTLWKPAAGCWLAYELKTEDGLLSLAQVKLLRDWKAAGVRCGVARPRDEADWAAMLRQPVETFPLISP